MVPDGRAAEAASCASSPWRGMEFTWGVIRYRLPRYRSQRHVARGWWQPQGAPGARKRPILRLPSYIGELAADLVGDSPAACLLIAHLSQKGLPTGSLFRIRSSSVAPEI